MTKEKLQTIVLMVLAAIMALPMVGLVGMWLLRLTMSSTPETGGGGGGVIAVSFGVSRALFTTFIVAIAAAIALVIVALRHRKRSKTRG